MDYLKIFNPLDIGRYHFLTGGWRGVKIGGQPLGMGGGLGTSNDPLVQAFDKAKAEQDRTRMENIARQMNELRLKENEAKAAKKAGADNPTGVNGVIKREGNTIKVKSDIGQITSTKIDDAFVSKGQYQPGFRITGNYTDPTGTSHKIDKVVTKKQMVALNEYVRTGSHNLDTFQINEAKTQNRRKRIGQLLKEKRESNGVRPIDYKGQRIGSVEKYKDGWGARDVTGNAIFNPNGSLAFRSLSDAKMAIADKYQIE